MWRHGRRTPAPALASRRRHVRHIQVSSAGVSAVCLPAVCLKVRASSRLQPLNIKPGRRRVTDTVDSSALFIGGGAGEGGGTLVKRGLNFFFFSRRPPKLFFFFLFCLGGRADTSGQVAHRQRKNVTRRGRALGGAGGMGGVVIERQMYYTFSFFSSLVCLFVCFFLLFLNEQAQKFRQAPFQMRTRRNGTEIVVVKYALATPLSASSGLRSSQ